MDINAYRIETEKLSAFILLLLLFYQKTTICPSLKILSQITQLNLNMLWLHTSQTTYSSPSQSGYSESRMSLEQHEGEKKLELVLVELDLIVNRHNR